MNRVFLVATLCFLFVSGAAAGIPATATVAVNCNAGDRIMRALRRPAVELTIEISGICVEDVEILRKNVTLRGTDRLTDGIRPAPDGLKRQVITVFGTNSVSIENLNLAGANNGIGVNASFSVFVTNCIIEDNSFAGMIAGTASNVRVRDTVIRKSEGESNRGIWVTNGSDVICRHCTIENHRTGILLTQGSRMLLDDSTVQGNRTGLDVNGGSRFGSVLFNGIGPSTIEGVSLFAIRLNDNSSAFFGNDNIIGRISLVKGSVATLRGAFQSNPSFFNDVISGSSLVLRQLATLDGNFDIREFSNVTLPTGSTVSGSLSCSLGADAFCGDPSNVSGTSNCDQCPKP